MSNYLYVISPDTGEVTLASRKFYETSLRDRGFTPADGWSKKDESETDNDTEAEKDAEIKTGVQTKNEAQRQNQKGFVRGK